LIETNALPPHQTANMPGWGQHEGHPACKKTPRVGMFGGGDLTGAMHVL